MDDDANNPAGGVAANAGWTAARFSGPAWLHHEFFSTVPRRG